MNDIIAKIQKLLALATSSNEHEATLAAKKAQELLVMHNLDMQTVQRTETDYHELEVYEFSRLGVGVKWITQIVQEFFFVQVLHWRSRGNYKISFVGDKTNTATAQYVFNFLCRAIKECWLAYKKSNELTTASRASYFSGFNQGLRAQLNTSRKSVEDARGLVLVRDPGIKTAVAKLVGPVSTRGFGQANLRDNSAERAGYEDGKNLKIAKALGGPSERSGKLIGEK